MANRRKSFDEKRFICKKCSAFVGREMFDRQCLVVGSLAFFNFARFACLACEAINNWTAPNLSDEPKTFDETFPDELSHLPKRNARFNKTGVVGVSQLGNKFRAVICINRKQIYLGLFDTLESASEAYQTAKKRLSVGLSVPENYIQKLAEYSQ